MTHIDLAEFLQRLVDDLWVLGREENVERIVLHMVHPLVPYLPRQLLRKKRVEEGHYKFHSVGGPTENFYNWKVPTGCWEVVKVSMKRYPTGLKISILVHRIEGS